MRPRTVIGLLGCALWIGTAFVRWYLPLVIIAVWFVGFMVALVLAFLLDCLIQDKWPWEMRP
jgi:phosphate/sulfate permease